MRVISLSLAFLVCGSAVFASNAPIPVVKAQEAAEAIVAPKISGRSADGGGGHGGGAHGGGGGGGGHGGGHGGGGGGHGGGQVAAHPPAPSYGTPQHAAPPQQGYAAPAAQSQDTGYYYYYYPVVEEDKEKGGFMKGMKDMMDKFFKSMMYPIMYPFMMMYDMFSGKDKETDSYGGGYGDQGHGGGGSTYTSYRSFTDVAYDYVPWKTIDSTRRMLLTAVKQDECLDRAICHSAYMATGQATFLDIMEVMIPKTFKKSFRTFKDSALKKGSCKIIYKCKYLDGAIDIYNELQVDSKVAIKKQA